MANYLVKTTSLDIYLREINAIPLLSREEEQDLARCFREKNDLNAAQRLVMANLRFVVKIAGEYRNYGMKLKDLIQEGNVGLMRAVKKFDPGKGYRLITYAVWWIRAYIQKYILDMWSLVKIGTTQAQRKLFRSLAKARHKLKTIDGQEPSDLALANSLEVPEKEVVEMKKRLGARDASLDARLGGEADNGRSYLELMSAAEETQEERLEAKENSALLHQAVAKLKTKLNEKEKTILKQRLLTDDPKTLEEIGQKFSISRERVRQLEERVKGKIKGLLTEAGYSYH